MESLNDSEVEEKFLFYMGFRDVIITTGALIRVSYFSFYTFHTQKSFVVFELLKNDNCDWVRLSFVDRLGISSKNVTMIFNKSSR